MYTILQWNLNGFYKKLDELKILISEIQPTVICLQETNFKNNITGKLPNYTGYSKNRTEGLRASGGATIYVKTEFPCKIININSHLEVIAVRVKLNHLELNLCNIYLPNQHSFDQIDITNILKQIPSPFIITGDFNSHNTRWGSKSTDRRGNEIEKAFEDDNIVLLNNNEPTHINIANGLMSNIDLSLSSASLAQRLEWKVYNNLTSSDHFPIIIKYLSRIHDELPSAERWNLKSADWPLFYELLDEEIKCIKDTETVNINSLVYTFTNSILKIANLTIGKSVTTNKKPKVPWWNQNIKMAIKDKHDALKKFQLSNTQEDFIQLKKLRARTKYLIKTSKKASWENFTCSINENSDSKLVWNKIHSLKGLSRNRQINLIDNNTDLLMNNDLATANKLGEYFYNNSSDKIYKPQFQIYKQKCENETILNNIDSNLTDQIHLNKPISSHEVTYSLAKCKSHGPGPDNIPYIFIQNFGPKALELMLKIFNRIFVEGSWPITWKNGTIIPITKQEKNKFKPEGYRPITLLNTMCKLLEKVINRRLTWFLEKNNLLSNQQSGFRKNRSTIDNLFQINHEVNQTFLDKQVMGLVNLDIAKAYDSTWRHNILIKLNQILSKGHILNIITDFLKDRTFQVKANNQMSSEFSQENGVPQGSALSVTLFLLAIDDITQCCSLPVKCNLFADDFNYSCRSNNINTVQKFLQITTNNLEEWAGKTGFNFSPKKSNCIVFTKKLKVGKLQKTLDGMPIPNKKSVKILGLFFDSRLTWATHIHHLKTSTINALKILKILSHTSWGGDSQTLIKIHRSTIQFRLNY